MSEEHPLNMFGTDRKQITQSWWFRDSLHLSSSGDLQGSQGRMREAQGGAL